MKKLLLLTGLLWSALASAQFVPGQVLTAAELNSAFAQYAPLTGATFTGGITGTTASFSQLAVTSAVIFPTGSLSLSDLATESPNTIVANATSSAGTPTAIPIPSCSTGSSALQWTSNTGFACNAAINASTLGGVASSSYALLASPSLTGTPTAPNAAAGTNTTQIATTAFVEGTLQSPQVGVGSTAPNTGKFTTLQATGAITPAYPTGIVGNTTGSSVSAGSIGESVSSNIPQGSAVPLTSNTQTNITSITLTAGDWDVWGNVVTAPAGTTIQNSTLAAISTVSATIGTPPLSGGIAQYPMLLNTGAAIEFTVGPRQINVSTSTTVFLVILSTFSTSTNSAYGFLIARRR